MKKLCLLSGMMVFLVAGVNASEIRKTPRNIKESRRQKIEDVQWEKIKRQQQLARPSVYTMIDAAITERFDSHYDYKFDVNWGVIFNILDSMSGVISVNEYRTYEYHYPLLCVAIKNKNLVIVQKLLEKYKANPNLSVVNEDGVTTTTLNLARQTKDDAIINLLIKYGAQ